MNLNKQKVHVHTLNCYKNSLKTVFCIYLLTVLFHTFSLHRVHTVIKSDTPRKVVKFEKLMHFPRLEKSWILGKMTEFVEKSWNFIFLVQIFLAV